MGDYSIILKERDAIYVFISFSALTLQTDHYDGFARSLGFHIGYCCVMHQQDINNCSPWSLMNPVGTDAYFEPPAD